MVESGRKRRIESSIEFGKFEQREWVMKTLSISIPEVEFEKLGIKNDNLTYAEFIKLIRRQEAAQALNECVALAEKYGLSNMTMEEIDEEVKAVRNANSFCNV